MADVKEKIKYHLRMIEYHKKELVDTLDNYEKDIIEIDNYYKENEK